MSSAQLLIVIAVTALASSLCTLTLGLVVFQRWLRPRLETRLEAFAEVLEARVKAGAGAAGQELLEPLRAQVRGGVEDAASAWLPQARTELTAGLREAAVETLPAFREEVRKGFADAIASLATSELLDRTARKVVRTGSSLMESGLGLLRGARPDRPDEPPR
ncbi:MAG: hypothetical protein JNK95_05220 [Candidatus Competibacter sp.]|nr:hypothetical protein [Candidatus Competibacter sp.]MDG4607273.1 hypothetical protein [Candidatus Contendobacter sp.]